MPLRKDAANPAEYGGISIAEAFPRALAEAGRMGWSIVDASAAEGWIEATAETFWYGFKDDIIVRIRPDGKGSRVDVRSVSRVGSGDMGTNARCVMKYLVALGIGA